MTKKQNTDAVYDAHDKIPYSAYAIVHKGEHRGLVTLKFPKDGAGRLYCFLHVFGVHMVRGYAGGYGYDKKGCALTSAAEYLPTGKDNPDLRCTETLDAFHTALDDFNGAQGWETAVNRLRDNGVELFRAL
jgi:hypothetical protein